MPWLPPAAFLAAAVIRALGTLSAAARVRHGEAATPVLLLPQGSTVPDQCGNRVWQCLPGPVSLHGSLHR